LLSGAKKADELMNSDQINKLADELFRSVEKFDMAALDRLYAADTVVWHNTDNIAQSRTENLKLLSQIPALFEVFKYTNIRRELVKEGFVQQHDLVLRSKQGAESVVHICMVVQVRNNKIARIDEYMDSAQINAALAAAG
jgi:ketosteroid isomerase-like protein